MVPLKGDFSAVVRAHFSLLLFQGLRIALPAALFFMVYQLTVKSIPLVMPQTVSDGMAIGGGLVVAVGYAPWLSTW